MITFKSALIPPPNGKPVLAFFSTNMGDWWDVMFYHTPTDTEPTGHWYGKYAKSGYTYLPEVAPTHWMDIDLNAVGDDLRLIDETQKYPVDVCEFEKGS